MKASKKENGFTLIELLVVIAIIGVLAAVVLAALNSSREKGADAAVKSNLVNAARQAEIMYNTRTANFDTYTGVCTDPGPVDGAVTVAAQVKAAAKATGLANFSRNVQGTNTTATCNDSGAAWAAEAPLETILPAANQMWCVDSTGKSKQTTGTSLGTLPAGTDYTCI